jgi:hypothetical protein
LVCSAIFVATLKTFKSLKSVPKTELPFTLIDHDSDYYISKQSKDTYLLNYKKPNGETQSIYIDPTSPIDFEKYLNKSVEVKGTPRKYKKEVTCIQAPCEPITIFKIYIESINLVNTNTNTPVGSKDERCSRMPEFYGMCLMAITGVPYYDQALDKCLTKNGGGCGVTAPFESMLDCESSCVGLYTVKKPYDRIIFSNGVEQNGTLFKFDLKGDARLNNNQKYVLKGAYDLNYGEIKTIGVVEKLNETKAKNSTTSNFEGTNILLFLWW